MIYEYCVIATIRFKIYFCSVYIKFKRDTFLHNQADHYVLRVNNKKIRLELIFALFKLLSEYLCFNPLIGDQIRFSFQQIWLHHINFSAHPQILKIPMYTLLVIAMKPIKNWRICLIWMFLFLKKQHMKH